MTTYSIKNDTETVLTTKDYELLVNFVVSGVPEGKTGRLLVRATFEYETAMFDRAKFILVHIPKRGHTDRDLGEFTTETGFSLSRSAYIEAVLDVQNGDDIYFAGRTVSGKLVRATNVHLFGMQFIPDPVSLTPEFDEDEAWGDASTDCWGNSPSTEDLEKFRLDGSKITADKINFKKGA